ncbi:hypothetical protein N44_02229 [Microcystis aeruginosa NIES-44]|uniref:Uncharacterized protein n=1 Tax=Microcystis aeruginosa NIES-44 TaxID=449439 RepID=A0A0A1VUN9_MICAE|nr:hypothetical protein N44_02229 [Microcystis aeruginosa NIES-44]
MDANPTDSSLTRGKNQFIKRLRNRINPPRRPIKVKLIFQ